MRREFFAMWQCPTKSAANRKARWWAEIIARVEDGFMAFESRADWLTWKRQK